MKSGTKDKLELDTPFSEPTGITATAKGVSTTQTAVRVVLIHNKNAPNGWQILTAFPR